MTPKQLKIFCAKGISGIRYYLRVPFSRGDFTYATDGHILIKVPRLAKIPENSAAPDPNSLFDSAHSRPIEEKQ